MPQTIFITGANRGLGLEFTHQYAKEGVEVIACCRHPDQATELHALQKKIHHIKICQLDVTSPEEIQKVVKQINQPIDILINNAGILEEDVPLGQLDPDELMESFQTNAIGPLKVMEALIPNLAKSQIKLVVNITSKMGSIEDNSSGGYYSYRASKTALNMLMKSASIDLESKQIKVLLLHPGWVRTRMGGSNALIDVHQSVTGMRKVIKDYISSKKKAMFYTYQGEEVPW